MLALFLAHPWINDKAEKHASSLRAGGEQAGFPRQEDGGNLTALQLLQLFSQTGEFLLQIRISQWLSSKFSAAFHGEKN